MTRKLIAVAVSISILTGPSYAQELGIELNGGLQGTQYRLSNGQVAQLAGGSLGLSYSFRLGTYWDLVTGLAGGVYRTRASLQDSAFTYDEVDDVGSAFEYSAKPSGYQETQQFIAGTIPLLLQFHTSGARTRWYFDAGGRALLPLNASVRQSARQLSLSGYYPDYNITVSNLPEHGFGTIPDWKGSQTIALDPAASLTVATGLSFRLTRSTRLYAGLYLDYGLTRLKEGGDSLPFATYSYTGVGEAQVNSVLKTAAAGPMSLLSYGLQLRLSFGPANPNAARARTATQKHAAQTAVVATPIPAGPLRGVTGNDLKILTTPVLFGTLGETSLSDIAQAHLNLVAAIMLRNPGIRISIVGHICNSGMETESPKVGEARAKAVEDFLRSKGIRHERMDVSFATESDPVVPNNPGANYQKRRAVITVE